MFKRGFIQRGKHFLARTNFLARTKKLNPDITVNAGIVRGKIPTTISEPTQPIRDGFELNDTSPTYSAEESRLHAIYPSYERTPSRLADMLYEDVVFFKPNGMVGIDDSARPVNDLRISVAPTRYQVPRKYQGFARAAVLYFKERRKINFDPRTNTYENNRTARLNRYDDEANVMHLAEATYFDQVATNIVVDTEYTDPKLGHLPSFRNGLEAPIDGALPPLEASVLANSLGVAAMVYTPDYSQLVLRIRNGRFLASMPEGGLHCSASGVFELHQSTKKGGTYDADKLLRGMRLELWAELRLRPDQYDLYLVALARELPRGGKPQLFFVVRSHLEMDEMVALSNKAREKSEYIQGEDGGFLLGDVDLSDHHAFTYEGWAALNFAEKFLEANALQPEPIRYSSMS